MICSPLTPKALQKRFSSKYSVEKTKMDFLAATKNKDKLVEISRILAPLGINVVTDSHINISLEEVEETGTTFLQNARLKAVAACKQSGLPAIADDSGLEVDALNGAPGIHSARYAGENATDLDKIKLLLENLKGVPKKLRTARFVCYVCCAFPDGSEVTAFGECKGTIAREIKGTGGFGYDPVFLVDDKRSFAELNDEEKDKISHRGKALRQLAQKLSELNINDK